jgi:hypothetical protein
VPVSPRGWAGVFFYHHDEVALSSVQRVAAPARAKLFSRELEKETNL